MNASVAQCLLSVKCLLTLGCINDIILFLPCSAFFQCLNYFLLPGPSCKVQKLSVLHCLSFSLSTEGLCSGDCSGSLEIAQWNRMNSLLRCSQMIQENHRSGRTRFPSPQNHKNQWRVIIVLILRWVIHHDCKFGLQSITVGDNNEEWLIIQHGETDHKLAALELKQQLHWDSSSPWQRLPGRFEIPKCCTSRWWFWQLQSCWCTTASSQTLLVQPSRASSVGTRP